MKKLVLIFAALFALSSQTHAQLGSATNDLVYTPVTPCRLLDTRPTFGGSGPIASSGVKIFAVSGVANYTVQGGSATNCGMAAVGPNARAIAIYLTVVTPAASGWITAYENGVTAPAAATVNFKAGDVLGNTTIVPVTPGIIGAAGNSYMNIFASSATNVVGDIVGYYSKPVATGLNCTTVTGAPTSVPAGAYVSLPALTCAAGFTPMNLFFSAGENVVMADSYTSDTQGQLFVRSFSANTNSVTAKLRCCQIPGR